MFLFSWRYDMHIIKTKKYYYKYQGLIFNTSRYNSLGTRMEDFLTQRISDFIDVVMGAEL